MKDPGETVRKFREFTDNIERRYYQPNFLFSWGYYEFLTDLGAIAERLRDACRKQVFSYNSNESQSEPY